LFLVKKKVKDGIGMTPGGRPAKATAPTEIMIPRNVGKAPTKIIVGGFKKET
jgi:hypothetical protein